LKIFNILGIEFGIEKTKENMPAIKEATKKGVEFGIEKTKENMPAIKEYSKQVNKI
jgi:hypothetical protein